MSLATAKAALVAFLTDDPETGVPVAELEFVERVWSGEPRPGDATGPIVVTVRTTGMDATDIGLTLAVYAMVDTDAIDRQDQLDETIDTLEVLLGPAVAFTRGDWQIGYDPNLEVFVASCPMTTARGDF